MGAASGMFDPSRQSRQVQMADLGDTFPSLALERQRIAGA